MRSQAVLAVLLLAVPLAAASSTVLAEGSFSFVGEGTHEVSFTMPAGTTDVYFEFTGTASAPHGWAAALMTVYEDGAPDGACYQAAVEALDLASGCWLSSHSDAGFPETGYRVVFEARGSGEVSYRVWSETD